MTFERHKSPEKITLSRTRQCTSCPWRVEAKLADIPGYERGLHEKLRGTIGGEIYHSLRIMACHHSTDQKPVHCLGWLMNQLGPGNNLNLRLYARRIENLSEVELLGKQHTQFEDTLRKDA